MKKAVIGILAHVDAGKTTLSEAMLYLTGAVRRLGRVDHQDAFLDTFALERQRGITIFSKQAQFPLGELEVTLLDTPGHVDFSAEMERTLQVLDYAILVVSGTDGIQGHTQTLWELLRRHGIPTFLFINKMDLAGAERGSLLVQLQKRFGESCVDFGAPEKELAESAAMADETLLEQYLKDGALGWDALADAVARCTLTPCCFGSALQLSGVEAFLAVLKNCVRPKHYGGDFAARVFKIARDEQNNRLTYLKVTGGALRVKDLLSDREGPGRKRSIRSAFTPARNFLRRKRRRPARSAPLRA